MQRVSHGSSGLRMGPSLTGARRRSPGRAGHHRRLAAVGGLTPDLSRKVPAIGARIRLRQTEGSGSIGRQAGGPGDGSTVPFASATVLVPASLGLREPDRPLVAPNVSLASGRAGCLFPASLPRHLAWPEARTTRPRAPAAGDSATWCGPFAPATLLVPARLGLRDRPAPARRLPPLRRPDSVRFRPRHSTPPPATPISPDHVQLAGSVRRGGPAALRSAS
jgi:hypothetical protein